MSQQDATIELVMARLSNGGKSLQLNNLGLIDINQCIKDHLQLVQCLELNNNELKKLDGLESQILETFEVSYNELSGALRITYPKLVKLNLSFNNITSISLVSRNIQQLNLEGNKIQKIDFLSNLKELKVLNLGSNNLEKVDFLIFNTQLEELNIRKNRITTLKGGFANTPRLRVLDARNNRISEVQFIDSISELEELNLSGNSISILKFDNKNENMNILDLSHNLLDDIRIFEFRFPYLTHLYIQGNQIYAENSVSFLKLMSNLIEVTFENNPFYSKEFEDQFIVECPWLELVNDREVGKPGQYVRQELKTLKEKLQELDIDVDNFHLSDIDNEEAYVTEERLKAILRVQGFQDDEKDEPPQQQVEDGNEMMEEEFLRYVTESNEQMDNIRVKYLRKFMKTQESEQLSFTQQSEQPSFTQQPQQHTPHSISNSSAKQLLIRSVPKPQKKQQQSILSEISSLKQNMKSKEFYQSLGFSSQVTRTPMNRVNQQRMNLSSENFNKTQEMRSSSTRPQLASATVKLPKI